MKMYRIKWLVAGCLTAILFTGTWYQLPAQVQKGAVKKADAKPGGRDLDKELSDISNARQQLEKVSMQDFSAMQEQLQQSLAQLDQNKIQLQIQQSLNQANIEQSLRAAELAMQKIDLDKIAAGLDEETRLTSKEKEKVRQELSKAKIQFEKEIKNHNWDEEMKKIDWKQIEKEMQAARIELEKVKLEIDLKPIQIQDEISNATKELDEAESELKGYQEMIYSMERAKLINTGKNYTIEWNASQLKINGKLQPQSIADKYSKYFKDPETIIKKENGKMSVSKGHADKSY